MTDSKIKAVQSKLENGITELKAEIHDLGAEVQAIQSMVLETSFHTMQAIDGNKAPLREWVGYAERCCKSGGGGCGLLADYKVGSLLGNVGMGLTLLGECTERLSTLRPAGFY